jgi:hypothetical protein
VRCLHDVTVAADRREQAGAVTLGLAVGTLDAPLVIAASGTGPSGVPGYGLGFYTVLI